MEQHQPHHIIIRTANGQIISVHSDVPAKVSIIREEAHVQNGDAAHVAGLRHDAESLLQLYPKQGRGGPSTHRRRSK